MKSNARFQGKEASISSFRKSFSARPQDSIHLEFLDGYVRKGDAIYVHRDTGVVTSDLKHTPEQILEYWSDKIFTSSSVEDYSAYFPFARGRLYYVVRTFVDFLAKARPGQDISFCDFATGQGVLPHLLRREMPKWSIRCTEGSKDLCQKLEEDGFIVDTCVLGQRTLPSFRVDLGSLTWTLCNCIRPLDVMMEIRDHIENNGYLVIADSSRLLVPFRKSLRDLFNASHPADSHPYFFSANSLCALLRCAGFTPVFVNRYFDSDVLLVIGQKQDELPSDDVLAPCDAAEDIRAFFSKYHELTATFDNWKSVSPGHSL